MDTVVIEVEAKHRAASNRSQFFGGTGETAPLDFDQLCRRCMGRLDLAERLLASFERRFPLELVEIQNALATGDTVRLAQLAHQLKGASANISAPAIQALMQKMEDAARAGEPAAAADLLARLQCEWEKFTEYRGSARLS